MPVHGHQGLLDKVTYPEGGTNTAEGLRRVRSTILPNARSGSRAVLIVVTDGVSADEPATEAQRIRDQGVLIYSVGIGNRLNLMKPNLSKPKLFELNQTFFNRTLFELNLFFNLFEPNLFKPNLFELNRIFSNGTFFNQTFFNQTVSNQIFFNRTNSKPECF